MDQTLFNGVCVLSFFIAGTSFILAAGELTCRLYDQVGQFFRQRRQRRDNPRPCAIVPPPQSGQAILLNSTCPKGMQGTR
jgi:hypothetical protein